MDPTKIPFLSAEERADSHGEESDGYTSTYDEKHPDYIDPAVAPRTPSASTRTARALKIALGIWLGVVLITVFALPRMPGCSLHRAPVGGHVPGGEQMRMVVATPVPGEVGEVGETGVPAVATAKELGYKVVEDLPNKWVPKHGSYWGDGDDKRLIFIGDVHGSYRPLKELLKKLSYDSTKDHIVLLGDMITRGRKSIEVLNFAMAQGASCVRGNHEDRILLLRKHLKKNPKHLSEEFETTSNKKLRKEIKLAKKLSEEQVAWLESCPVILNVQDVPGVGHLAAVHAGLRVGVPLAKQDPVQVMNMRSIDPVTGLPTAEKTGKHWATVWNHAQRQLRRPITVVYGHYASAGLDIRRYSMGLDTDCNRDGKLTALVIDSSKNGGKIVQVDCRKLADK